MRTIQLANIIIDHTGASRAEAFCFAWRILNEYPEKFREAALDIAEGLKVSIEVDGIDLESVMSSAGVADFYALELMRIISCDAQTGKNLVLTLGLRM